MDIIAAHREGLTEKLDMECADLAGRARDFGQRAIVLHHIYDHSLGTHWWALVESRRQMAADRALQALEGKARRWWRGSASREEATAALTGLRQSLGNEAARRTAAAYRAYRMAGTPALVDTLENMLSSEHGRLLVALHAQRRDGRAIDACDSEALALAVEQDVGDDPQGTVELAFAALDATFLGRAARRAFKTMPLVKLIARHRKRGWTRIEQALRDDPFLPAAFRANPAQHFFALQHGLADRRRRDWVEGADDGEALAA